MNPTEEQYREMLQRSQELMGALTPQILPKPKRQPRTASESEIERVCTQILIHDGWRPLKTDPVSDRRRGKGFGELGMADYLYIRYADYSDRSATWASQAQVLWVEFKAGHNKAEEHQTAWHIAERAKGALVWVANEDFPATVEGFLAHYNSSGLRHIRS